MSNFKRSKYTSIDMATGSGGLKVTLLLVRDAVFILLLLSGIFQILNAMWTLRTGTDKESFIRRGLLGTALVAIAFVLPALFMSLYSMSYTTHLNG